MTSTDQWTFTHNGGNLFLNLLTEDDYGDGYDMNEDGIEQGMYGILYLYVKDPETGEYTYTGIHDHDNDKETYNNMAAGDYMVIVGDDHLYGDRLEGYHENQYTSTNFDEDGKVTYEYGHGPYVLTIGGDVSNVVAKNS